MRVLGIVVVIAVCYVQSAVLPGYYKVVCYFTNWSWYREGSAKYLPEDINPDLCTHITYRFAVLDDKNLIVKAHDSWADINNNFYERVVAFKKKGIKVSLALGGWNDSQGDKYSRLVSDPAARKRFIEHVVQFLKQYNFDGLDLDWEFPKCWQVNCDKGPDSDKQNFGLWVREMKGAFREHGLLLSADVSRAKTVIDAGYDVKTLADCLDWITVMTYDYHGQWDAKTGHVAPLYEHPDDDFYHFNSNFSINYWISKGVHPRKLVMGMPLYGHSFSLSNPRSHGLNAPASGPGTAGEYTRNAGFLSYYEICDRVQNQGWAVVQDDELRMGPYAYKGDQWVSYDDKATIKRKSEYIREMNLGGGMIRALDLDDFKNTCGGGSYPLLNTIVQTLAQPLEMTPIAEEATHTQTPSSTAAENTELVEVVEETTTVAPKPKPNTETPPLMLNNTFKVVCYFTNWARYRQGTGKYLPVDVDPELCTHIVYGFAVLDADQLVIKPHYSRPDLENKFYEKVTALKKKGVKVSLAIGGWSDSAGGKYSKLVNSVASRARFTDHVLAFILDHGFNGLDLVWEYPKCWQANCKMGPDSDKEAFADWVRELHAAFQPHGLLLSAAVSPYKTVIDAGYDVPTLSRMLDWIAVMAYDFHEQHDRGTGHVAPMYANPEDDDVTLNVNFTIHYWASQGADRRKLVLGMPMYGQSFSLANRMDNDLDAPTYGGGEAGEVTMARGFLAYYEICERVLQKGWEVVRDPEGRIGPYARLGDQWVSFDDQAMIRQKSEFVLHNGFGGAMIWSLDLDDFRNQCGCEKYPLLRTINRVLRQYPGPGPDCLLDSLQVVKDPGCEAAEAHASDCTRYYACVHGQRVEKLCPAGLHFNATKKTCGLVSSSGCQNSQTDTDAIEKPPSPPSGAKVVCYFTNWSRYRPGKGKFLPKDIEQRLCTHIVYTYAVLDPEALTVRPNDEWTDLDNEFYRQVTALRAHDTKVLLGVGGWNDSRGDKYSRLVNDPAARTTFITHLITFLRRFNFDGVDLGWEYPTCWQANCSAGPDSDKQGFAALVSELSLHMRPQGLLLSAAVSPSKLVVDKGYDVPTLAAHLDWIGLKAFDYHGYWDNRTGHVAPLYYSDGDIYPHFNTNFSVHYWLQAGVPPHKLVLGMPLYGQTFTLEDPGNVGLGAPSTGPGLPGPYTGDAGVLAFYEICERVSSEQWTVERSAAGLMGAFAHRRDQWVSYDDVSDIHRKTEYIKHVGLGGAMVWALDLDDFNNQCGCGKSPLLSAVNQGLHVPSLSPLTVQDCT